jgi:hypothetical protein
MWKSFTLVFVLLFFGCKNSIVSDCDSFSQKDSITVVNNILDSMQAEMNRKWFMKPAPIISDDNFESTSFCIRFPKYLKTNKPPYFSQEMFFEIDRDNSVKLNGEKTNRNITSNVVYFFSKNRSANQVDYDFALYIIQSRIELISGIKILQSQIQEAAKCSNYAIKRFFETNLQLQYSKLRLLNTLSSDTLSEPHYQTCVKLSYPKNCKINEKIRDSLLIGFYKLREMDAKSYFENSYARIFWKATKFNDTIAKRQLEALNILHPIYLLDFGKSKYKPKPRNSPPPPTLTD